MYKRSRPAKTTLKVNNGYEGETMPEKIRRIKNNKEPLTDPSTPLIFTERGDGVIPEYDIRTDKFEILIDANEKAYEQAALRKKEFEEKLEAANKAKEEGKKPENQGNPETGANTSD